MKLRIKGNSLRLRVSRSEATRLQAGCRIEETIQFAEQAGAKLTYALEKAPQDVPIKVRYADQAVTVTLSDQQAFQWTGEKEVGVYYTVSIGSKGSLDVVVEKDFACLDGSDADNEDTFLNPFVETSC